VPTNKAFGGGVADSVVGPGVLVLMLIAIVLILLLPRRYLFGPLLFGIFLLPYGQTFVLGGLHVFVLRLVVLAGLIRGFASRPSGEPPFAGGFKLIDKVFIAGTIYGSAAFILRFRDGGAVVNQFGVLWDVLGAYFLVRFTIRDDDDVLRVVKTFSLVAAILGVTMLYEKLYDMNLYKLIAGHPIIPEIRNGSIRAQGPFHHSILAGCFGATLMPLFFWLWKSGKSKLLGIAGMLASTAIAISSASSTPVSAYIAGIIGISFWPLRKSMSKIRWGILIALLALNFAMHAPVWYLLEHIDLAGGSSGGHRAELIDNFVRHFGDWWLIGTNDNANWGFEMWDISNNYIAAGEGGGLVPFICFVAIIVLSFKMVGNARKSVGEDLPNEWYFWILGVAVFSHTVAFFGISYFDQTQVSWYALLAMIVASTTPNYQKAAVREPQVSAIAEAPQLVRPARPVFNPQERPPKTTPALVTRRGFRSGTGSDRNWKM